MCSLLNRVLVSWESTQKPDCEIHGDTKSILKNKTWEEPCPLCFISVRKKLYAREHNTNGTGEPTANDVNLYLRFLTYPSPRLDFYFQIFNQILAKLGKEPISIENEVYRTITKALKDGIWEKELSFNVEGEKSAHDEFLEERTRLINFRLNLIAEWFLSRYHIFAAFYTLKLSKFRKGKDIKENLPSTLIPVMLLNLFLAAYGAMIFGALSVCGFNPIIGWGLIIPVVFLWAIPKLYVKWTHSIFRLFLPRQLGAIVAGYFLMIIVGNEFWDVLVQFIKNIDPFIIPASLIALIAIYLFWEVKNQLGFFEKNRSWLHALVVLEIGLLETLVIGGIFFNFAGIQLQPLFNKYEHFLHSGPLLLEQLSFIASYMALTLFVGIFLQIFWQDKPITVSL